MDVPVTISWPPQFPLPHVDFTGGPLNTNLTGGQEMGITLRRRRFTATYQQLQVRWVMTPLTYRTFNAWFVTTLKNGAASFAIELRYPKESELTQWQVRFFSSIRATYADALWMVEATLFLLRRVTINEPIAPIDPAEGEESVAPDDDEDDNIFPIAPNYDPTPCPDGVIFTVSSAYVWGWHGDVDPNANLAPEWREAYKTLFFNEKFIAIGGITVLSETQPYWQYISTSAQNKSALNKVATGNLDPEDPEGDHNTLFSEYWYLAQDVCYQA